MRERGCVVVFSKPARPGRVKTRLIGDLSAEQTALLHQAFLDDLMERLRTGRNEVWLAWDLDDGEAPPSVDVPALRQRGPDLGARLFQALAEATRVYEMAAAVGSDHPELPLERIDEAFDQLSSGVDVVLGPAGDGGYYLVAVRRGALVPELFEDIKWSTDRVLTETLQRCRQLGLEPALLELGHDVDTPADLPRLGSYLALHPEVCPRTRRLFDRWGLSEAP